MAAANTTSSEIPCSVLWSEYYGVLCPADTKAGFNPDPGPGTAAAAHHKGSTVDPAAFNLGSEQSAFGSSAVAGQKAAFEAPEIERFPREPCRGSNKTPASPSSQPRWPT